MRCIPDEEKVCRSVELLKPLLLNVHSRQAEAFRKQPLQASTDKKFILQRRCVEGSLPFQMDEQCKC